MPHTIENVTCFSESSGAIRVSIPHRPKIITVWIPKSQIDDDSEVYKQGTNGKLVISDWWAEKKV